VQLIDRLLSLAELWAAARGLSVSRLGNLVVRDGNFFERVAAGRSCTITTFEKFVAYFREAQHWPDAVIPPAALALLDDLPPHAAADTPEPDARATGNDDNLSGAEVLV
jgi:hypothetical protein